MPSPHFLAQHHDHALAQFDPSCASDADWLAQVKFERRLRDEKWPETPHRDVGTAVDRLRHISAAPNMTVWFVWNGDRQIVGAARLIHRLSDPTSAMMFIQVLPETRRRGIGTVLLASVAAHAARSGLEIVETETSSCVPAGELVVERLSGHPTRQVCLNELAVPDLNVEVLRAWSANASLPNVTLSTFNGSLPDDLIRGLALLKASVSASYASAVDDLERRVQGLRALEERLRIFGIERWITCAITSSHHEVVGYCEFSWDAQNPHILEHSEVAVATHFRAKGLARMMIGRTLESLLVDRPAIRSLHSTTSPSTAPTMAAVDAALGFRVHHVDTRWSITIRSIEQYTTGIASSPPEDDHTSP